MENLRVIAETRTITFSKNRPLFFFTDRDENAVQVPKGNM
jgi:hypothetical protein